MHVRRHIPRWQWSFLAGLCALAVGCYHTEGFVVPPPPPDGSVPRELNKVVLPPYVIEPPDILLIEVLAPPDLTEPDPANPGKRIDISQFSRSQYAYSYAISPQPVEGGHVVGMDGTISLGIYGFVPVAGLTRDQARERIREHMARILNRGAQTIQVVVDVAAYNSKVYYVIVDGAGYGEQVHPLPFTGNETVLDAIGRIGGLPQVSSKRDIWLARRSPSGGPDQVLPVCWEEITKQGITRTNYQVLPGDRVYVNSQRIISIDNTLAKVLQPIERLFGITLLGASTVQTVGGRNVNGGGNGQ
jgi:polysaccharide export outer membrane protein